MFSHPPDPAPQKHHVVELLLRPGPNRAASRVPPENQRLIATFLRFKTPMNHRENRRRIQGIRVVPVSSFRGRLTLICSRRPASSPPRSPPPGCRHAAARTKYVYESRRSGLDSSGPRVRTLRSRAPGHPGHVPALLLDTSKVGSWSHPKPVELNQRS